MGGLTKVPAIPSSDHSSRDAGTALAEGWKVRSWEGESMQLCRQQLRVLLHFSSAWC